MGYLSNSLKEAIGGKSFNSSTQIRDWSPNEIRAIFIMRDFILVAYYLKPPKVVRLDVNEVNFELSNPASRGNLNKLLENRQLSCLEEIYVDSAFSMYKHIISLEDYVASVYNQSSRLRYFGYVRGFDVAVLREIYSKAVINGNMDFTAAKNMGSFSFNDTGNTDWYKRYNLRPQYYTLDSEKGKLHTYFSKCEKVVGDVIKSKDAQISQIEKAQKVINMFKVDLSRLNDIRLLMKFIEFSQGVDDFTKEVAKSLKENMTKSIPVKGLAQEDLIQAAKMGNIPFGDAEKYLVDMYRKVNTFTEKGSEEFDPSKEELEDGIYKLGQRLDIALASVLNSKPDAVTCMLYLLTSKRISGLPEGRLVDALRKKNILMCRVVSEDGISGLIDFAYSLCGFRKEDFIEYLHHKG